jgi:DNA modification methylase
MAKTKERIAPDLKGFEVAIETLQPDPENARRRTEENLAAIRASFEAFGQQRAILVYRFKRNAPPTVISGNGGFLAAKSLGWTTIAATHFNGSVEEARAYAIADNRTAELSEWDAAVLAAQVAQARAFEVLDVLMDKLNIDDLLPEAEPDLSEDGPVEIPAQPTSKVGDVWKLGDHRIACGDSTKRETVAALFGDDRASMLWTDPPWNVAYGSSENPRWKHRAIKNDNLGDAFEPFLRAALEAARSVLFAGAPTYLVMSAQEWPVVDRVLREQGWHWSSTIVWVKDRMVLSRKDYHTQYEPIWYGWLDGAPRIVPIEDRKQSDVWNFDRPSRSDEHPTMKPIALVSRSIWNSTVARSIVFDPFLGSGTTVMACERSGRRCFGIELDPAYVDVVIARWGRETGRKAERA